MEYGPYVKPPFKLIQKNRNFNLKGIPLDVNVQHYYLKQKRLLIIKTAKKVYDAHTSLKKHVRFKAEKGAEDHC